MERVFFPDGVAGVSKDVMEGRKVQGLFESKEANLKGKLGTGRRRGR